jgi:hypothetical protein
MNKDLIAHLLKNQGAFKEGKGLEEALQLQLKQSHAKQTWSKLKSVLKAEGED